MALPGLVGGAGGSSGNINLLTESRSILYLGTSESKPVIEERRGNRPVYNDILGESVPVDMLSEGAELWVGATLNRFNYPVYRGLCAVPNGTAAGPGPGFDPFGAVGTLLLTEARNIWVIVEFPYAPKYASAGMVPGYFARGGVFLGPDKLTVGTNALSIQVVFQCLPVYDKASQTFTVYSNTLPPLPAVD